MRQQNNKFQTTQCVILKSALAFYLLYIALTISKLYSCHIFNNIMARKPNNAAIRKPDHPDEPL